MTATSRMLAQWSAAAKRPIALAAVAVIIGVGALGGCAKSSPDALMASAKKYAQSRNYSAAIIELKNLLQQQPENAEARFLFGTWLMETGDYGAAENEFRRALQYRHPDAAVVPLLVRVMVEGGQAKKVIEEFGSADLRAPEARADLQAQIGNAHLQLNAPGPAAAAFTLAKQSVPGHPGAAVGEARLIALKGDAAGAEKAVDGVLASNPTSFDALYFKSELLLARRKFGDAVTLLTKIVESTPRSGGSWFMLVLALADDQKFDEAKKRLAEYKKAVPRDVRPFYLQAWMSLRDRNLTAARDAGLQMLKQVPDHTPTLVLMGLVEYETNNLLQAEDYLKRALERAPRLTIASQALVSTYLRMRQPQRALERIEPLLRNVNDDPRLLYLAGEVFLQNNRMADARRYFEQAAAVDTKNPQTQLRLGQIYLNSREDERASQALANASTLDPASDTADMVVISTSIERREYPKALAAIDALDKKRPTSTALTQNLRASVYLSQGDTTKARDSLEKALTADPTFFPAALNLANLELRQGKRDAARGHLERVLTKDPKNTRAAIALADLLIADGRPSKEVTDVLEKSVRENRSSVDIHSALIGYHLRSRDAARAVTAGVSATASVPDSIALHDLLGLAQQSAGDYNQAVQTFQKLAGLSPGKAGPWIRVAAVHASQKQYDSSIKALRKATEVEPGNLDAVRELAAVYVLQGQPEEALREARAVQKRDPKQALGYALEGDVFAAQKRFADADRAYDKGLKISAEPGLLVRRVLVLDASGSRPAGDTAGAQWLRENPKDVVARSFLAERALQQKDFKTAAAYYRDALALQPNDPMLLNNMAWASGKSGDARALEYIERALAIAPESPAILDTYGSLLVERGQAAKGVDYLRRASALAPANAEIRLNLARSLASSGDKTEARREAEAALRLRDGPRVKDEAEAFLKKL